MISPDAVAADATLPVVDWEQVVELEPPPVASAGTNAGETVPFTPFTVAPLLANPAHVRRALEREYPATLRDAGIGGDVGLLIHIDATGRILEARVGKSSGYRALDDAALRVAAIMAFRPAMNRDTPVAVWISQPLTFTVRAP